jgi:hypothetical protein
VARKDTSKDHLGPAPKEPVPGRRIGAKPIIDQLSKIEAKLAGILPHEWLLKVMQGEPIKQKYVVDVLDKNNVVIGQEVREKDVYPDFDTRQEAAKAAAPYYAPRLATQVVTIRGREDMLNQMTDEQIDKALKALLEPPKKGASE